MKSKDIFYACIAMIVLLALWLFIDEREKSKRKDQIIEKLVRENQQFKLSYLNLLEKYLKATNKAEPSTIKELQRLKSEIDHLDTATHQELSSVIKLIDANEGTKAVRELAKIVENHLKEKTQSDKSFLKKPMLGNLLEHAHKCEWINERMFSNGKFLRDIRNKESHELAVQIPPHEIGMAIFTGIDIIYSLKQVSYTAN
jgi:hypothetical protein